MRLAARYCDELNLNVFPDQVPELLEVFGERCAEIGRDPTTVELNWGTNQIMRYKGLKVTGGQRFAEPHELAYQDPERVANVGTRAEELAAWNELGFDRCTAGIPGLHNTDEGLYEFIDDCRTAGIDFFDRQPATDRMTVRVGVVGSGFMGRTWSEVAANHATGTSLSAVTGGTRATALAADYGIPLEPDLDALLARDDVDAVILASPPAVHLAQTLAAAAAGRHVLVEKPMAQSAAECAEMVAACRAAGVRLSVVSQHRFRDAPVAAKKLIDDGAIGEVRMIQVTGAEVGWWDLKARGDEWKLDPRQQTAWASWGAHSCDLLRWFSGARTASWPSPGSRTSRASRRTSARARRSPSR